MTIQLTVRAVVECDHEDPRQRQQPLKAIHLDHGGRPYVFNHEKVAHQMFHLRQVLNPHLHYAVLHEVRVLTAPIRLVLPSPNTAPVGTSVGRAGRAPMIQKGAPRLHTFFLMLVHPFVAQVIM